MKLIYLNRWGIVFHAILTTVTEDEDRVLASRVCMSLEEARRLIEGWQLQHGIARTTERGDEGSTRQPDAGRKWKDQNRRAWFDLRPECRRRRKQTLRSHCKRRSTHLFRRRSSVPSSLD